MFKKKHEQEIDFVRSYDSFRQFAVVRQPESWGWVEVGFEEIGTDQRDLNGLVCRKGCRREFTHVVQDY